MAPVSPLLKVEGLTMQFGGLIAVNHLSFEVQKGEITALIGPNGAGKTTVFNCVTGFYKPNAGHLHLQTEEGPYALEQLADHAIVRTARVARTFQNIRLFQGMSVLENLMVAQHCVLMKALLRSGLGLLRPQYYKKAQAQALDHAHVWLQRVRLEERADDPAGALPYGAQRRLEIARAMCTRPLLLCLDEPAAGLNPHESADLSALLKEIQTRGEASIFLIEHDMSVVMDISHHIIVLDYGAKIADGSPQEIQKDPNVIAAYLGIEAEENPS